LKRGGNQHFARLIPADGNEREIPPRMRTTARSRGGAVESMMQPKRIERTNMKVRLVSSIAMAAVLALFAVACGSSTSPSTVSAVAVSGTPPAVGATSQFSAMATLSDGTTQDVTNLATWVSSNTDEATVSSAGLVTGVGAGTVTIQATYQSVTGSDQITLTP
jgi:uncharacterized protein YjdB